MDREYIFIFPFVTIVLDVVHACGARRLKCHRGTRPPQSVATSLSCTVVVGSRTIRGFVPPSITPAVRLVPLFGFFFLSSLKTNGRTHDDERARTFFFLFRSTFRRVTVSKSGFANTFHRSVRRTNSRAESKTYYLPRARQTICVWNVVRATSICIVVRSLFFRKLSRRKCTCPTVMFRIRPFHLINVWIATREKTIKPILTLRTNTARCFTTFYCFPTLTASSRQSSRWMTLALSTRRWPFSTLNDDRTAGLIVSGSDQMWSMTNGRRFVSDIVTGYADGGGRWQAVEVGNH